MRFTRKETNIRYMWTSGQKFLFHTGFHNCFVFPTLCHIQPYAIYSIYVQGDSFFAYIFLFVLTFREACCSYHLSFWEFVLEVFFQYLIFFLSFFALSGPSVSVCRLIQSPVFFSFLCKYLCRWFRFAQLAKGKKSRP